MNVGSGYRAWDAADPNHIPDTCSFLQRTDATITCGCTDENSYSLFTGQSLGTALPFGLKEYRVTVSGSTIVVSN